MPTQYHDRESIVLVIIGAKACLTERLVPNSRPILRNIDGLARIEAFGRALEMSNAVFPFEGFRQR